MNSLTYRLTTALLAALLGGGADAWAAGLLLTPDHGGDGSAWGLERCAGCHPLSRIHGDAPNIRGLAQAKGYAACTGCHGDNGSGAARACVICHNPADLPATPARDGTHRHDFPGLTADAECLVCHHASDMNGDFRPDLDLTALPDAGGRLTPYYSGADFCLRCHNRNHQLPGFRIPVTGFRDPLTAMQDNYAHVDFHGLRPGGDGTYSGLRPGYDYRTAVECSDCHAMHGTANPGLIIDDAAKGASRLEAKPRPGEIRVTVVNGDYAQLCVLCHRSGQAIEDAGQDTGNGLSGVHQAFGDCRPCHAHGQAEQAGL